MARWTFGTAEGITAFGRSQQGGTIPELGLTSSATVVDGGTAKSFPNQSIGACIPICKRGEGRSSPVDRTTQAVLAFLTAVLEAALELVKDRSGGAWDVASAKGGLTAGATVGRRGSWSASLQPHCADGESPLGL